MREGWRSVDIGDVCKVIAGQSPKGSFYNVTGNGLPFYQGKKDFGEKYIGPPSKWTSHVTKEALAGDILMSVRAPVGPINFSTEKVCIGRGLAAIRPTEKIERNFLFYVLLSKQAEICGNEGAVFPSINKKQIQEIPIPLPPLPEQQRIVAILDEAFEGIATATANAEKNLKNACELFESYLNAVFMQKGEGWIDTTIGELCTKMEYGTSSKSKSQGAIPVLRMGNIQGGRIDWKDLVYTDDGKDIEKYLLRNSDVLFNRTNSAELVGKTAIYKGEFKAIFAGYLIRIHRKKDLINADYLNYYLNSSLAKNYGKFVMSRSINQANINATKLKQYPISIPELKVQTNIVSQFDLLSANTKHLQSIYQKKLTALAELKQSLLQKAFAGELTADFSSTIKEEALA